VDPIVCVNVLSMFAKYGREHDLPATVAWVRDVLYHRAYLGGTRYYGSAEAFLFFFTRFVRNLRPGTLKQDLHALLSERVRERLNTPVDALALSMRIQACHALGFDAPADIATLITMQDEDGGWPAAVIYKYGAGGLGITNRGVSTAFAVKAITGSPVKTETNIGGDGARAVSAMSSLEARRLQPISSVGDWVRFIIASLHVHLAWLWNVLLLSKVV
jgi:hypothetical protein